MNQAAKVHYMSGGAWKVPMVMRATLGASRRSAAQHSQSLQAWLSHVPGLKVAMPSTPYDAKGLMKTAIRDDNPVIFFEDKMMFRLKGPVPVEEYTIPFGVADIKRDGDDITIVATSSMVQVALGAAKMLEEIGDQRGGGRSADHLAAGRKNTDRIGAENFAGDCGGRGLRAIRRHRGNRFGDRHRRVLRSGRAGKAHRRDARARFPFLRRWKTPRFPTEQRIGVSRRPGDVRKRRHSERSEEPSSCFVLALNRRRLAAQNH